METLPQDSQFWEKCARHASPYTARTICWLFVCDSCTSRLTAEAFNGRPPIYHGDRLQGFCGLCNELTDVRLRQWFLCPLCSNVVGSYQKAFVSARSVHEFWRKQVAAVAPSFQLDETDTVVVTPYARSGTTKRIAAESARSADFLVSEHVGASVMPRFHIELKAGPGAIEDMSEFQLDVNDYNDIVGPVINSGLPAYVFHVQLGMEYFPPTRRAVARNLWWTDIIRLQDHLKRTAIRRDESKAALYFDPRAFQRGESFPQQLLTREFERLREQIAATPLAML